MVKLKTMAMQKILNLKDEITYIIINITVVPI